MPYMGRVASSSGLIRTFLPHYSDWVCTAVMSNDVMKDLPPSVTRLAAKIGLIN